MKGKCIVFVGLSGVGKSTCLNWLEAHLMARRVRRHTTRSQRLDDDPSLVICVNQIHEKPGDFIYAGWGESRYAVTAADLESIIRRGEVALVELGAAEDGLAFKQLHPNALLVWVKRGLNIRETQLLLESRGMVREAIDERIASMVEDELALLNCESRFDVVLTNDGTLKELHAQLEAVVSRLGVRRKTCSGAGQI